MQIINEDKELRIRELETTDVETLAEMASDGSLKDIFEESDDYVTYMSGWIEWAKQLYAENNPLKDFLAYGIIEKTTGHLIGSIGCSAYEEWNAVGITYFVGSNNRRRRIATKATKLYLDYFFREYPTIDKLIATIKVRNLASNMVVQNAGFQLEKCDMYQDYGDEKAFAYNFYSISRCNY